MHMKDLPPIGLVFVLISWTLFGLATAYIANKKGRNPYFWFFVGFFLAVLGLLLAFFMPKSKEQKPEVKKEEVKTPPQITDTLWYYLDKEHKQHGPVSQIWLDKEISEKRLNENTYVWNENLKDWEKVKDLK